MHDSIYSFDHLIKSTILAINLSVLESGMFVLALTSAMSSTITYVNLPW